MDGKFITATAMERDHLDWGVMGWLSRPAPSTGAKDLVVIEVTLEPGCGHNFHKHPGQEEVIYVVAGAVEERGRARIHHPASRRWSRTEPNQ